MAIQVFWTISSEHDSQSISCRYFIHKSLCLNSFISIRNSKKDEAVNCELNNFKLSSFTALCILFSGYQNKGMYMSEKGLHSLCITLGIMLIFWLGIITLFWAIFA